MRRASGNVFSIGMLLLFLLSNHATSAPAPAHRLKFELRLAEKESAEGLQEMVDPKTKNKLYVHRRAILTNADIAEARVSKNQRDEPAVIIVFTEMSRKKVLEFSVNNTGKIAAILIDGKLVFAPTIHQRFSRSAEISGSLTQEEAERIAKGIKAKEAPAEPGDAADWPRE